VQFNDVPVAGWCKERVGASDDGKKFLMGRVMADRNTNGLLIYIGNCAIDSARRETSHRITKESVSR
jgi:hypothetical protein